MDSRLRADKLSQYICSQAPGSRLSLAVPSGHNEYWGWHAHLGEHTASAV